MEERELVIVGGGPAGMAAVIEARRAGVHVTLIDERPTLGGQIYKQPLPGFTVRQPHLMGEEYRDGQALIGQVQRSGAEVLTDHVVWGLFGRQPVEVAVYGHGSVARTFRAERLILATGAYDRPVPFPGWTLPGVLSAGGAHSLVKVQRVKPGKRVIIAGSGPVALAFSAQLHQLGVDVVAVLEASPMPGPRTLLALLVAAAAGNWGLLAKGLRYMAYLRRHGVPLLYGHAIARAEGGGEVERAVAVRLNRDWRPLPGTERVFDVDTVCVGYGFLPSTEAARLLGCALEYHEQLGGYVPARNEDLESSIAGVFVAGDGARIAGSATAIEEGRVCGIAAARQLGKISQAEADRRLVGPKRRLATQSRFREALNAHYRVGPGIYEWATDETIICRCEEVTAGELRRNIRPDSRDPNYVKSLTRVGMGLCQGRNCARQVGYLFARETGLLPQIPPLTARPPLKPVPIGLIADTSMEMPSRIEKMPEEVKA